MEPEITVEQREALKICRRHAVLKRIETFGAIVGFGSVFVSGCLDPFLRQIGYSLESADRISFTAMGCSFGFLLLIAIGPASIRAKIMRESRGFNDNSRTSILIEAYKTPRWFYRLGHPRVPENANRVLRWLYGSRYPTPANPETYAIPLRRLLPKIRVEDAVLFGSEHHAIIRSLLTDSDPRTAQGAVHAIGVLGDERDLPPLDAMAGNSSASDQQRAAAATAAATIRARIAGLTAQNSLVRASTPPQGPELLLRPIEPDGEDRLTSE